LKQDSSKRSLLQLHPSRWDVVFLLGASTACLTAGLQMPILTVRKLWEKNTFSILSGINALWDEKYYFLAGIIFFFSIVFPIAKLTTLISIWFVPLAQKERRMLLYFLELLGKWSMLDVFVAAVIIVSVKLGALASAKAEPGIYYFGASIALAMTATAFQSHLARRTVV
jgi:paraquat-inducible protein A